MSKDKLTPLKLTEEQTKNLKELLDTYHGAKLITRLFRWLFIVGVLFIVDLNRLMEGVGQVLAYIKRMTTSN